MIICLEQIMSKSSVINHEFDEEFQQLCDEFVKSLKNIKKKSIKKLCSAWLKRLVHCKDSERSLRSSYLRLLLKQMKANLIEDPFSNNPDSKYTLKPLTKRKRRMQLTSSCSSIELCTSDNLSNTSELSSNESTSSSSTTADDEIKYRTKRASNDNNFDFRKDLIEAKSKLFQVQNENKKQLEQNLQLQKELQSLKISLKFKNDSLQNYKISLKNLEDAYYKEVDRKNRTIDQLKSDRNKLLKLNDEITKEKKDQTMTMEQALLTEKINFENEKMKIKENLQKEMENDLNFHKTKTENLENLVAKLDRENRKLMKRLNLEVKEASLDKRQNETLDMVREISYRANVWSDISNRRNCELERVTDFLESRYRQILEEHQQKSREDNDKHLKQIADLQLQLAKNSEITSHF